MQNILIIGAGRSTFYLIDYLSRQTSKYPWEITVVDFSEANLDKSIGDHDEVHYHVLDFNDNQARRKEIAKHDVVISMAPPIFHSRIARDCLDEGKHLLMASYITNEIQSIHEEAKQKGLLFLNELGLDPGLDHLSAKQAIDDLHSRGAKIKGFYSYTGGLIAPESDDNPWHYKISWNPMNVVKAGYSWARYLSGGKNKIVPYNQLFKRLEKIEVPGYGIFDGYYNRNALPYKKLYGLEDAENLVRGTLRKEGFCGAWNLLIQTGLTYDMEVLDLKGKTNREVIEIFIPEDPEKSTRERWSEMLGVSANSEAFQKLEWLGLLEDKPAPVNHGTPADFLKQILLEKLVMKEDDRDLVLMVHCFDFEINGEKKQRKTYLAIEGEDNQKTAMAKTVGLPLGIATKILMKGELELAGVHLPMVSDIYEPILEELKKYGIIFREEDQDLEKEQ